ncbi:MAG: NADPH:quinone oxidoreductase family protein [Sphingobium sp.]
MTQSYQAIIAAEALGGPERYRLAETPPVPLTAGEVRLEVAAAGVSYVDVLIAAGRYQKQPPLPFVPGTECSGTITEVADDVRGLAIGQRVVAGCGLGGAFARQAHVAASDVIPIPDHLDFADAAGTYVNYQTAYHGLVQRAALQAGERLLVLGASGGIGSAAIEIGRALGAIVIASASTPEKRAAAMALGACATIPSDAEDWRDQVKALTEGRGADVVVDPVGGTETERAFRALAWNGRLLVVGFLGGAEIPAIRTNLPLLKGAALIGVDIRQFREREPDLARRNLDALNALIQSGALSPTAAHRFPMHRFAEAMDLATRRDRVGRIVIDMRLP